MVKTGPFDLIIRVCAPLAIGAFFVALLLGEHSSLFSSKLSIYAIIPILGLLINGYLLAIVVKRRASIRGAIWFAGLLVSSVIWSLTDLGTFTASSPAAGMIWRSAVILPGLLGVSCLLMFALVSTGRENDDLAGTWSALLASSSVFLLFGLATDYIFDHRLSTLVHQYWGYDVAIGPLWDIYGLWVVIMLVVTASVLFVQYHKQTKTIEKKRARILFVAVLFPILGTTLTAMVPAAFSISTIPIDSVFTTLMAAFMYYGLRRYDLFIINPTTVATNILETMAETVIVTNTKFELEYTNKNAEKVFGISSKEASQKRIDNFFAPQHFSRIREHLIADPTLKTPKKFEDLIVISQHTRIITPVDLSISSILDAEDRLSGYVFVMTDISALKHAYAQLADEERKVERKVVERTQQLYLEHTKLEASIASLPIGFIMLDEKQRVLEVNKVAIDLLKLKGKTKADIVEAVGRLNAEKEFERVQKDCVLSDLPDVLYEKRNLHVIVAPIVGKNTDCLGCVILIEDTTKQKIAEKERNEFIITASHEMRTPLTIIQGNLANALDPEIAKLSKETKPLVEQAYSSTMQISELFKDILTVSEIDNGAAPHYENKSTFDFTALLADVVKQLRPKAEAKKLALSFSGHESKLNVHGDPNELKEVVLKLTENAIKYTSKGYVSLELKTHGDWILLSVADSGIGISPADRKKLFKKFARLDNKLTREVGGTGLGLYIARSLAQRNGGEVILEHSTHKGSIFTLRLPAKPKN